MNLNFLHDIFIIFLSQSETAVYKIGRGIISCITIVICNLGLLIRDHNLSSSGEAQKRADRMIYRAHLKKGRLHSE